MVYDYVFSQITLGKLVVEDKSVLKKLQYLTDIDNLERNFRNKDQNKYMFTEFGKDVVRYIEEVEKNVESGEYKNLVLYSGHDQNLFLFFTLVGLITPECKMKQY